MNGETMDGEQKLLHKNEGAGGESWLDDVIQKKESEHAAGRKRTDEAEEVCGTILRERVGPCFDRVADRLKGSSLERRIESCSVDSEDALFLKVTDLKGKLVEEDQLICFCDAEKGVINLDIGEANSYMFDFDVEPSGAGQRFRSKAGETSHSYDAFSDEVLERNVQLYLECFL